MAEPGHGSVGTRQQPFTRLLPPIAKPFAPDLLVGLAAAMQGDPDTVKDGADPEENLMMPAGYTYFGQFIDHDLTFDSTSSLDPSVDTDNGSRIPTNLRTPRFDLDSLYGDGPAAQPFMYAEDGATLLFGGTGQPTPQVNPDGLLSSETAAWDLLRGPNGRALIGDKRNDENSIVCQIQLGFVKFHNATVRCLVGEDPKGWNVPGDLFASARNEVRWTYQSIIVDDFLPRVVRAEVLEDLRKGKDARAEAYVLYKIDLRTNLPREFVGAAYRYGHSGVRTGYRLNRETRLSIFPSSLDTNQASDSLQGFDPLPRHHVIDDWGRFLPKTGPGADKDDKSRTAAGDDPNPEVRLQFAYKLDPTIVDPLGVLPPAVAGSDATGQAKDAIKPGKLPNPDRPSLALLNLLRGNVYGLASGQAILAKLKERWTDLEPLSAAELVVRASTDDVPEGGNPDGAQAFRWTAIHADLQATTPLWFYVLAEAQARIVAAIPGDKKRTFLETELLEGPGAISQLGWVGGRIVAEVFYGLLDSDGDSFVNSEAAHGWKPRISRDGTMVLRDLIDFGTRPF